jgi:hypothetical protein
VTTRCASAARPSWHRSRSLTMASERPVQGPKAARPAPRPATAVRRRAAGCNGCVPTLSSHPCLEFTCAVLWGCPLEGPGCFAAVDLAITGTATARVRSPSVQSRVHRRSRTAR